HFRRVAVLEREVAVEIGMAQRMMRRLDGPAARAGAAGDPAHEERRRDEAPGEEWHAGEQDRGGEAARVAHVRRGELAQMLGHGDEAQELPGYVAAAAEHHRRNPAAHCAAAAGSPSASITRSPRAAPLLMALQAGTPIWVVMISTPTWLSVAGPVTRHGSM